MGWQQDVIRYLGENKLANSQKITWHEEQEL